MPASASELGLLLQRTARLLRTHPVLALPVLFADMLAFTANHLQHALHAPIVSLFLVHRNSVLSTTRSFIPTGSGDVTKVALLVGPLLWASCFVSIFLYTAALRTVFLLVQALGLDEADPIGSAQMISALHGIWHSRSQPFWPDDLCSPAGVRRPRCMVSAKDRLGFACA